MNKLNSVTGWCGQHEKTNFMPDSNNYVAYELSDSFVWRR